MFFFSTKEILLNWSTRILQPFTSILMTYKATTLIVIVMLQETNNSLLVFQSISEFPVLKLNYCCIFNQGKKNKKLFWMSSAAPLLSVIVSSIIAYRVNVHQHEVKDYKVEVLGPIKGGTLNPSSLYQMLHVDGEFVGPLIKTAFAVSVISLTVGCLHVQTFYFN